MRRRVPSRSKLLIRSADRRRMTVAPSQAYLRTKVLTASPAELRLLLLDGALRFAENAKRGYEERNFELSYDGTTKCQAILTELMCSLRPERNPELCTKLSALYTFMYTRVVDASLKKDPKIIEEVIGLLQYDRETWVLLMEEIAKNGDASSPIDTKAELGPVEKPSVSAPKQRISLQG